MFKKKERKKGRKGKRKEKKPQPKKNKKGISVACILIKCQPLSNRISTENGKNDVL